jgi:hypothetical protein
VAGEVAGTVEPFSRSAEGIGHEAFGGQVRAAVTPVITAGEAGPAEKDFTRHADRRRHAIPAHEVDPDVVDRPAESQLLVFPEGLHRGADRGLGRAVGVEQGAPLGPAGGEARRAGFAGDDQHAHRQRGLVRQRGEGGRRQGHAGDPLLPDQRGERRSR